MNNYPYIPFVPNKDSVMRRMGSLKASFDKELKNEIDGCYTKAMSAFTVRGRAEAYEIARLGGDSIEIMGNTVESRLLAVMLSKSSKAFVMCAAIPESDVRMINEAISRGEGLLALVLDAYASELVDGALDVIMQSKNESLRRAGQSLTKKRFSAGYGDLDIKYQKVFYDLLEMQTLGVKMNEKYLLIPEKSVIAIAGVE